MTVVLALAVISIALALSYSVMRSQAMALRIEHNSQLGLLARQSALTGLAIGWRKMHQSDWPGVNGTIAGKISSSESYSVVYRSGDPQLSPGSAEDTDWPYRVSLLVTGTAADPVQPGVQTTCRLVAVARLVPRQLAPEPAAWPDMQHYTVYQWASDDFSLELPCRLEGPVRLQGRLLLAQAYPEPSAANGRHLSDLNAMRGAGYPDYRPLDGPVHLPFSRTEAATLSLLTANLGLSVTDIPETTISDWDYPGPILSYQIYPGGETYQVPTLAGELADVALGPDPRSNPLGLFYRAGDLWLRDNVSLRGTLITEGRLHISGANIRLESIGLPALESDTRPVHLPAAVVADDVIVADRAQVAIQGVVAAWDVFDVQYGSVTTSLNLDGKLIVKKLFIRERTEWDQPSTTWEVWWLDFLVQETLLGGQKFFPIWLEQYGCKPASLLTVRPPAASLVHHWKRRDDPVYVPHPADPGLRWDLLRLSDAP